MNLMQELIREYAHCEHEAAIYQSHSQPVPAYIQQRITNIEAWARVNVHPQHLQAAIQQKDQYLAYLKQEQNRLETANHEHLKRATLEKAVGKVTQGMLGQDKLNPNQLKAIVKKEPLRARIPNQTQAQRDAKMREATKRHDPARKGWTEKEFAKRMDELTDASPAEFARLVKKYGADPAQIRKAVDGWKSERIEYGLRQRRLERQGDDEKLEPVLHEVDDNTHRRAVLATAYLADANDQAEHGDSSKLDSLIDEIPTPMLEESGRRGDIARAFDSLESSGETV
jgi:hypothetical protein